MCRTVVRRVTVVYPGWEGRGIVGRDVYPPWVTRHIPGRLPTHHDAQVPPPTMMPRVHPPTRRYIQAGIPTVIHRLAYPPLYTGVHIPHLVHTGVHIPHLVHTAGEHIHHGTHCGRAYTPWYTRGIHTWYTPGIHTWYTPWCTYTTRVTGGERHHSAQSSLQPSGGERHHSAQRAPLFLWEKDGNSAQRASPSP